MADQKKYMQRALEIAYRGMGAVSPNPMVGCVLVHQSQIIGEGYHQAFGGHHAEVNAIRSVKNQDLLKHSTLYVTLEPCSHFGKTPPCANLIVKKGIPKVVIATKDPNPMVAGKGIKILEEAGVEVELGLLQEASKFLNRRFLKGFSEKRPFIILKWAETADGFIARNDFDSKWISNEFSRTLVHKWRAEEDAIMVGTNTVKYDNPTLNVRDWKGENPIRIIVDRNLRLPSDRLVFDNSISTILYHYKDAPQELPHQKKLGEALGKEDFLDALFKDLYKKGIGSILVEGGSTLLSALLHVGLWDEARVFKSKKTFKEGIKAPSIHSKLNSVKVLGSDLLMIYTKA